MNTKNLQSEVVSQSKTMSNSLTDQLNQNISYPKRKLTLLEAIELSGRIIEAKKISTTIAKENELLNEFSFEEKTVTGDKLVSTTLNNIPHLWEPYFPKSSLVGISGASEAGKSTFTRQLALAICNGDSQFLNGKLNLTYKSAIYLSTEDDEISMGVLLKKQTQTKYTKGLHRFRLGINVNNAIKYLENELSKNGADLVVIDVWTDVYNESTNDLIKVRANLNEFSRLAKKYKTCICILHHNTKHSEGKDPSKTNLNGSQAIEAKLRTLLEFRTLNEGQKQLSILKANYISYQEKKQRLIVQQDDNLNFNYVRLDQIATPSKITNPKSNNEEIKARAIELYGQGNLSQDKIVAILKDEFGDDAPSKGTLNGMLKTQKNSQSESL